MSVIRLIHIKVRPEDMERAEELWKMECAPLMIRQRGCMSEKLLKCDDNSGEYISYSEWSSSQDIENYRKSDAHREIVAHARGLEKSEAVVKCYSLVT